MKAKFRSYRHRHPQSDLAKEFKHAKNNVDVESVLQKFAAKAAARPFVEENQVRMAQVESDITNKETIQLSYLDLCREMGLSDVKDPANDANIKDYCLLGIKRKALSKREKQKMSENGFPEAAGFRYERSAASNTQKQRRVNTQRQTSTTHEPINARTQTQSSETPE